MPTIPITAPADRDLTVVGRNVATGQDGVTTVIPAGKTADVEIDHDNQVNLSVGAVSGETAASEPGAVIVRSEEPAVELREATDDEVIEAMKALADAPSVERTTKGYINTNTVNEALSARGLAPIRSDRTKQISDTHGLVEIPKK